jgi:hypothetical protein
MQRNYVGSAGTLVLHALKNAVDTVKVNIARNVQKPAAGAQKNAGKWLCMPDIKMIKLLAYQ